MIDAERGPGNRMTVLNETVAIHLEQVPPTIPSDLPWIRGQGLVFTLDGAFAEVEAIGSGIDPSGATMRSL